MRILITGGNGFLGSNLARRLAKNNSVKIIGLLPEGFLAEEELEKFSFTPCDMRDKKALSEAVDEDTDVVVHLAAKIAHTTGKCPEGLIETNVNATVNLLDVMAEKGIKRIFYSSSMTVYAPGNASPVKENSLSEPVHFYGLSKRWAEEAVIRYAEDGIVKALIMRYAGLFGYPRRTGYIYNAARKLMRNEQLDVDTTGLKFWEAMNVDDAAEMTARILDAWKWDNKYEVINCSYGEEADFVETAYTLRDITSSRAEIKVKEPRDYVRFYLDNSKLKELVGCPYTFKGSLESFISRHSDWLKK